MQRRKVTGLLGLATLSCWVDSFAAGGTPSKQDPPKRPFRSINAPEDSRRVLFFFDFACPFCAIYHEPLLKWSSTVPKGVDTLFVPVVNVADVARKSEQMIAAKCYYAAAQVATKDQMARFSAGLYEGYTESRSLLSKPMWLKAIKAAGISGTKFAEAFNSKNNDFQVEFAAKKTLQYGLMVTPSVGVGGRYVLTPEDVMGDQEMFFNILNGLTSEIL